MLNDGMRVSDELRRAWQEGPMADRIVLSRSVPTGVWSQW